MSNYKTIYNQDKTIRVRIEALLDEIKTFQQWSEGDVFGYVIEKYFECEFCNHTEWEEIDSCWGFYGFDMKENGLLDNIPREYREWVEKEI